ncbi:AAA family ATPase [Mesorhizobium sp. KR2-14]|uniref:ATP-dependent nuclease n=1 Tax=Mesorhizobium sp. KR2-14 TaxID=3156610 RepID=UPI0032B353F3
MAGKICIRRLLIMRFRGLEDLKWNPDPGMNVILGGGDCGKTTILEAIGLLFSPSNSNALVESDFHDRDYDRGFEIEAVVSVSDGAVFSAGGKIYWPWKWDGEDAVQPDADDQSDPVTEHFFRVSVTATPDFDLAWEIIQPDGTRESFPVSLRRQIGLVRLGAEDKSDRDLRLVFGSALDRLISDDSLRARISSEIAKISLHDQVGAEGKAALKTLDQNLDEAALPSDLSIGLTGSQGVTIGSLVGLFAKRRAVSLPLTSWGTGTRRMVAMHVAAAQKDEASLITIDEIERGLEPYRLRQFISSLEKSPMQAFVTTHSPVAIAAALKAQLWFLDLEGHIGRLDRDKIKSQQERDPETFLARLPVLTEGETEQGLVQELLRIAFAGNPLDAGTRVCLAQGNQQLRNLLKQLVGAGLKVAAFADDEGDSGQTWTDLKTKMNDCLFRWASGCTEEYILALMPDDYLENLFRDADGDPEPYRLKSVQDRLGATDKSFATLTATATAKGVGLKQIIIEAATGNCDGTDDKAIAKEWKKHARTWFKKADGSGGRELLQHLKATNTWSAVEPTLRPFVNAVLRASGKPELSVIDLP